MERPCGELCTKSGDFSTKADVTGSSTCFRVFHAGSAGCYAFTGRVGIPLERGNPVSKGGNGFTGYALANLVYDFTGPGSLSALGTKVKTRLNSTRVEGRLGANLSSDDDRWTLYTEAGVASAINGKNYTSFKGVAGARFNF